MRDVAHDVGRREGCRGGAQGASERGAAPRARGREGQRGPQEEGRLRADAERAVQGRHGPVAPGLGRGEVAEGLARLTPGGPPVQRVRQDPAAQDVGRGEAGDAQRRADGQGGIDGEQGRVGQRLAGASSLRGRGGR
nr:MAG TPA: hypothetical protein [Caudoviricetes sp.]